MVLSWEIPALNDGNRKFSGQIGARRYGAGDGGHQGAAS